MKTVAMESHYLTLNEIPKQTSLKKVTVEDHKSIDQSIFAFGRTFKG